MVSLNWKYKWSVLYVPNFKSIGWIVSKVEGGVRLTPPPPPRLRVTIFSRRLLGLIAECNHFMWECNHLVHWSREQRNVGICWAESSTGFKLDATYAIIMQHSPTWWENERNMLAQDVAFVCTGLKLPTPAADFSGNAFYFKLGLINYWYWYVVLCYGMGTQTFRNCVQPSFPTAAPCSSGFKCYGLVMWKSRGFF